MSKKRREHRKKVISRNQRAFFEQRRVASELKSDESKLAAAEDKLRKLKSFMKEEGKQVNMNGEAPKTGEIPPVYKFTPAAYEALEKFLLGRPLREARNLYKSFYKHGKEDPFYKGEAVKTLFDYLIECPLGEAEPVVEMLENGGLLEYHQDPTKAAAANAGEKKGEKGEKEDSAKETSEISELPKSENPNPNPDEQLPPAS